MDIATALAISAREFNLQEERLRSLAAELAAQAPETVRPLRPRVSGRSDATAAECRLAANAKVLAETRGVLLRTIELLR